MINRNEKIKLLRDVVAGKMTVDEFKKQIAIDDGRLQVLVGMDAEDYENGNFDAKKLLFVNGLPAKILSERPTLPVEEIYV